jgi:hypothetical protein
VKIITIEKPSAGRISEGLAQSGLAHRSNAHENEDVGGHMIWIFSTQSRKDCRVYAKGRYVHLKYRSII